jgi:hypothetical protein
MVSRASFGKHNRKKLTADHADRDESPLTVVVSIVLELYM